MDSDDRRKRNCSASLHYEERICFAVSLPPPRKSFYGAVPRIFGSRCGAEPELIKLQFKQNVGIRTEVWGEAYPLGRLIEPVTTGFLGWASFTAMDRCRVP